MIGADEVVVVAAPDLANLRNAKNIARRAAHDPPARPSAEARA